MEEQDEAVAPIKPTPVATPKKVEFEPDGQVKLFPTTPPKARRHGQRPYYTKEMVLNALRSSKTMEGASHLLGIKRSHIYQLIKRHELWDESSSLYSRAPRHTKEEFEAILKTCKTPKEVQQKCDYANVSSVYANLARWNLKLP